MILKLRHIAFVVTLNCTLKCKLCSVLVPYVKNYHPTFDSLKHDIDAFFSIVDKAEFMNLTGGEPLLRAGDSTLIGILNHLSEMPNEKLENIRIFTSGTVVPNDVFFDELNRIAKKKTFWFEIDNYGDKSNKLELLIEKLKYYKIKYNVRDYSKDLYFDGWVDFRLTKSKNRDAESAKILYEKCACGNVFDVGFIEGLLVACPSTYVRYVCCEIDKDHEEIINLFDDRDKMREKYLKLLEFPMLESCFYCPNGICKESKRYMPAEQVTFEEIEEFRRIHNKLRY